MVDNQTFRRVRINNVILVCIRISSLFTNIPLEEIIQICADSLYESKLTPTIMDKVVFIELMNIATTSVEFSFNNRIYIQIDDVAMGSPLGPALANIFVGYQEEKLFIDSNQPLIYFRYVDDTFAMFEDELNCNRFLKQLNSLHQSLNFTHEKEVNGKLSFLDVLVEKSNTKFLTSVYRKSSFSDQVQSLGFVWTQKQKKQSYWNSCTPSFGNLFAFKITPGNRFHLIDSLLQWLSRKCN